MYAFLMLQDNQYKAELHVIQHYTWLLIFAGHSSLFIEDTDVNVHSECLVVALVTLQADRLGNASRML